MKKFCIFMMIFFISLFAVTAQEKITFTTGETVKYYPVGVEAIAFRDHTPVPIISSVRQFANEVWELSFTVAALSNSTADGTYPVVITYYVKSGDVIQLKSNTPYLGDEIKKFKVISASWNVIMLEIQDDGSKAPVSTEDSL
ncbi:MAG: hypothetical protein M0P01_08725 [Treponema sp.]|nr:hypothetical protein [Treponema sp.]